MMEESIKPNGIGYFQKAAYPIFYILAFRDIRTSQNHLLPEHHPCFRAIVNVFYE